MTYELTLRIKCNSSSQIKLYLCIIVLNIQWGRDILKRLWSQFICNRSFNSFRLKGEFLQWFKYSRFVAETNNLIVIGLTRKKTVSTSNGVFVGAYLKLKKFEFTVFCTCLGKLVLISSWLCWLCLL